MGVYKDFEKRRQQVNEYNKIYAQKTFICECGCTIKLISKNTHLKTQKHKNLIELKQLKTQINNISLVV